MTLAPVHEMKLLERLVAEKATALRLFWAAELFRLTPNLVKAVLHEAREQPGRCAAFAKQAYWHSNGFAKVKLAEAGTSCIRLHIWPAGPDRVGEVDPHGHRWEFASWVAVGEGMTEERFVPSDRATSNGIDYTRYSYGRTDTEEEFLRPEGGAWLRRVDTLDRTPNHVYGCGLDVIHTVAPIGTGLVATVVLQGPVMAKSAAVYRDPGRTSDAKPRPISPAELGRLFADVDDAIQAGGS
jgi:hypothetical protein